MDEEVTGLVSWLPFIRMLFHLSRDVRVQKYVILSGESKKTLLNSVHEFMNYENDSIFNLS